jgi:hypothetical protein
MAKLRRARLWDDDKKSWVIIKPGQDWDDGDVSSSAAVHECSLAHLSRMHEMSSKRPSDHPFRAVIEIASAYLCLDAVCKPPACVQVESPLELETVTPKELAVHLQVQLPFLVYRDAKCAVTVATAPAVDLGNKRMMACLLCQSCDLIARVVL